MKIAGGEFKGRIIKAPNTHDIRPSTERTREAIFSALGTDILDARVADLFSGSGALGLEALSRGAKFALFVDSDRRATAVVRENIRKLGISSRTKVMNMNVLAIRPSHLEKTGIIFADPPYKADYADKLPALLSLPKFDWHGILILEHDPKWNIQGKEFAAVKRINFGDTAVSFLIRRKGT